MEKTYSTYLDYDKLILPDDNIVFIGSIELSYDHVMFDENITVVFDCAIDSKELYDYSEDIKHIGLEFHFELNWYDTEDDNCEESAISPSRRWGSSKATTGSLHQNITDMEEIYYDDYDIEK